MNDFYVYMYIDPRNHEEFYYGKGRGSRKDAHLRDGSDSEKAKRISNIRSAGVEPIIRVIARDLSENEALLVEKTLLWKLGKHTTNVATGHFADKFRPSNTLHLELSGFDFCNGIFYYNVGEGRHRKWDDFRKFGFISAGQGKRWRDAIKGFKEGDVFAAYLKKYGFVGVGRILAEAALVKDVKINGKPLLDLPLRCRNMAENRDDPMKSEYVCTVEWLAEVSREDAKRRKKPKLFTTTHVRASLDNQPETVEFINCAFDVSMRDLLRKRVFGSRARITLPSDSRPAAILPSP